MEVCREVEVKIHSFFTWNYREPNIQLHKLSAVPWGNYGLGGID
jgi:hypothetical protein